MGYGNWGEAATASDVSLEPGLWSLDNFGEVLIATIANGKTFTWNGGAASALNNRASTTTTSFETNNNPTASRITLISPTTRHLIHLATETTIGNTATQDDMFIRFSDQEGINTYTYCNKQCRHTKTTRWYKNYGCIKSKRNYSYFYR